MKKIICLIVVCFMFPIFADGKIDILPKPMKIEIVPRPVNDIIVGTDRIVVRGFYNSNGKKLKITVENSDSNKDYFPIILDSIDETHEGFYQYGVTLSKGNNRITLKELANGDWKNVDSRNILYEADSLNGLKSLWGRIANEEHRGEEQRAVFFYPGTRFPIGDKRGNSFNSERNISTEEFYENITLQLENQPFSPSFKPYILTISSDSETYLSKDFLDTKGPDSSKDNCWSSKERIGEMMDEIVKANANILIFVYWGDHHATLKDDIDQYNFPDSVKDLPDNYWKISPAPTFPETCNYKLVTDENICVNHADKFYLDDTYKQSFRTFAPCQCDSSQNNALGGNSKCGFGYTCHMGWCFKPCVLGLCTNNNERCACLESEILGHECKLLEDGVCIDKEDKNKLWTSYYYYKTEGCEKIYSQQDYKDSGMNTNYRESDAIDQMFKAAKDKQLLIVPTIEHNQFHPLWNEFPHNLDPVKQTIRKMLEKYGNYTNWLKVYDKNGVAKKAIMISQALGIPSGKYKRYPNGKTNQQNYEFEEIEIKPEDYSNAIRELADEFNVAFLLDNTSMPDDSTMANYFIPDVSDLHKIGDKLLGASIFGYPFDEMLGVFGKTVSYHDATQGAEDPHFEPLEKHMIKKAKNWLDGWRKNTREEEKYIPLIANVLPGFDDRWRGTSKIPVFSIYGDNEEWHKKQADLAFLYNTAGINLAIWNGYGEGYVWVPYRKRVFENRNGYVIHESFQSGSLQIPESYANLNLSVDKQGNPEYEDDIINDNYCFANYLFSARDGDKDGVPDACDNCPDVYNPMVINNEEIVAAPCENSKVGGAACMPRTSTSAYKDNFGNYWWQPDHDLDGTGDACDKDTVWSDFKGIPAGTSVENGITYQDKNLKVVSMRRNETLSVAIDMLKSEPTPISTEIATTRYCWVPEWDINLWGMDGYCTTEAGHTKGACDTNFGYSHGSDPVPVNTEKVLNWKFIKNKEDSKKSDEFTDIETGSSETVDWNWRYDFIQDNRLFEDALTTAPECTNFSLGVCQDANVPKFYYTMSTGVHDTDPKYLTSQNEINPDFFQNKQKYARSSRLTLFPVVISYHTEPFIIFSPIDDYCTGRCDFILEEYQEMIINELINGPRPYEMPGMDHYFKNAYGSDLINTGVSFREWSSNAAGMPSVSEKNRPMYLATITKNAAGANVGIAAQINNSTTQLRSMQSSAGVTFEIAEMDPNSNGDWRTKGILEDVPAGFAPTASVHHNGNLYVVSNGEKETQVYEIKSTGQTVMPEDGYNICFHPVKIVNPIQIGTLPNNLSGITLHSVGNSLMALGKGGNGMEVYKFSKKGFENITGANSPQIRDVYNVEVRNGVLYLAGGAELGKDSVDLKTDFWSFSETDGWQLVRDDLNLFPLTLRIDFDGENVILTNRAIRHNATTDRAIFNADGTGNITLETIKVEGAPVQKYEESFCISETGSSIFPGITNVYGECVKVENYDFDEVTFPDYKLSVAGYRNSLYLGGLTGIRRVETGENGEITKKEMIYSGESNNLAVYGNTLYAANYSEIDIFEIAEDGSIERKSSVKTNDCRNIRIEGGKLFAAENKRVRIFDLSDPIEPELLKTISLSNTVEDLEIAGNQLFVYENLNSLLTRKGKVSVFDISDLENTQKVSEFSQYCNDPEMQKSRDSVYLGCKNGVFKIEENGLKSISGSKNYLREGYAFDGILYQVFSGTLHESKVESEEIEEDGWF